MTAIHKGSASVTAKNHDHATYLYSNLFIYFQPVVNKSVAEMGKLYPDDLGEKIITRTDIDFVILIKERKENPN